MNEPEKSKTKQTRDRDAVQGVAIVGCGYWGINYVRVFDELPEARLEAICDSSAERLLDVGKRFPGARLTTNLGSILEDDRVDVAVICTGATSHHAVAKACIEAGKHVLIEKPITTTGRHALELIASSHKHDVTLMVGHTFLYNPGVRAIKSYMQSRDLGDIRYLYARRTNLGPIRNDVNALWDLAPHDVSIFGYLLDSRPKWVSAVGTKVLGNDREDVGFVSLGYENGVVGNIHVSWVDPNKVRELVVVGSDKRVVFDDVNVLERVRVFEKGIAIAQDEPTNFGEFQFRMRDGDIVSPKIAGGEPLKLQCSHFLECVRDGKRPLTDGWAGLDVVRVMRAIDRSIAQNGVPVEIDDARAPERSRPAKRTRGDVPQPKNPSWLGGNS